MNNILSLMFDCVISYTITINKRYLKKKLPLKQHCVVFFFKDLSNMCNIAHVKGVKSSKFS
jgi:hypothetical protein